MTSSFHCIPNSCARISYLVYELQSGIRYRYPDDDDWTVIDGDDYELIAEVEQAENIAYNVRVSATQLSQGVADENGDPTINERYTEDSLWGRYGEIPLNMPNPVYTLFQPNINGELYGEQVYADYEDANGNIRSARLTPHATNAGFDPESVTIIGIYKALITAPQYQ